MIEGRTLSIATGCKNRLDHLARALASWVAFPEVDEIVIVDWDSFPSVSQALSLRDERIKIVRVEDQPYWLRSSCHNLEFRLASGHFLLRIDSDDVLLPGFLRAHAPSAGRFWAGNWRSVPDDRRDQVHLSGILYVERDCLYKINGYNERLVNYGWEDDDICNRLSNYGLLRRDIDINEAEHIPHSDKNRLENLQAASTVIETRRENAFTKKVSWQELVKSLASERQKLVDISHASCDEKPWTMSDVMSRWWVSRFSPNGNGVMEARCEDYATGIEGGRYKDGGWRLVG